MKTIETTLKTHVTNLHIYIIHHVLRQILNGRKKTKFEVNY